MLCRTRFQVSDFGFTFVFKQPLNSTILDRSEERRVGKECRL